MQTNSASGNAVVAFERDADGRLTHEETIATGGLGSSAGLGDQGALEITADKHHLLVVNPGSDDVSLFKIEGDGLELVDVQGVGDRPVSVAVHGNLGYVLNQGADTIEALRISDEGTLVNVPHSTRPLSTANANAAQVAFSPDGRVLAVTEKRTQTIDTYVVGPSGRAGTPQEGVQVVEAVADLVERLLGDAQLGAGHEHAELVPLGQLVLLDGQDADVEPVGGEPDPVVAELAVLVLLVDLAAGRNPL